MKRYLNGCAARKLAIAATALAMASSAGGVLAQAAARATPEAWKAIVAAAEKEGRVVLYHATAPAIANCCAER